MRVFSVSSGYTRRSTVKAAIAPAIKMSELELPDICDDLKLVSPRLSKYDGAIGTEQDVAWNFLGVDIIMHHKDIFSNSACSDLPKSFFLKFLYFLTDSIPTCHYITALDIIYYQLQII